MVAVSPAVLVARVCVVAAWAALAGGFREPAGGQLAGPRAERVTVASGRPRANTPANSTPGPAEGQRQRGISSGLLEGGVVAQRGRPTLHRRTIPPAGPGARPPTGILGSATSAPGHHPTGQDMCSSLGDKAWVVMMASRPWMRSSKHVSEYPSPASRSLGQRQGGHQLGLHSESGFPRPSGQPGPPSRLAVVAVVNRPPTSRSRVPGPLAQPLYQILGDGNDGPQHARYLQQKAGRQTHRGRGDSSAEVDGDGADRTTAGRVDLGAVDAATTRLMALLKSG